MYRYSQVENADKVIQEHMDVIVNSLRKYSPDSIALFGSYGKGEGGFIDGGPVNDYDILLIKPEDGYLDVKFDLPVKVELHVYDKLDDVCTQQLWEIKYGSQLLYGEELELPDWQPYDIPFSDAINSLNRRVISMLVGKYEMMKDEPDYHKVMTQIGKMIIAIGDATLIKRGQFNPSYRSRLIMLNEDYIGTYYSIAVSHKLFGIPNFNPDELWSLWNQVRDMFRQYMINNQISTDYSDMLINFDERLEPETLSSLLEALGAGDWL